MDTSLYQSHLNTLLSRYEAALDHFKLDAIVLSAGRKSYYFNDDLSPAFHPFSGIQQWLPFPVGEDTFVVIRASSKPELVWPIKNDFWHAPNSIPKGDWQKNWTITEVKDTEAWKSTIKGNFAALGPEHITNASSFDNSEVNNSKINKVSAFIDFDKAIKTPYEVECIRAANHAAVAGHLEAERAFREGASELEIHLAYLKASTQSAFEEPYPSIIGLNEHSAILHYEHKNTVAPSSSRSFLIDAGASKNGYASDITRTYAAQENDFSALIASLEKLQLSLCGKVVNNQSYIELHQQTLTGIAAILKEHDICSLSIEEQVERSIVQTFFPHGLGHLLGLQVHDLGGKQVDRNGTILTPSADMPFLRMTRGLETGMVVTIEPGLYFIPMLIEKTLATQVNHGLNLKKIESLRPYGGIRIEDNVLVTNDGQPNNLTRESFVRFQ
ncbi:Xaa-Pro dipeptidase [Marinomonas mediterranea]|jgi:Xaa-Pro aminopeptidase|uniref:Xaa-Pro dipeptidase n=1 Tax=Marinomonas mediterranea (strain ATCC 700492 / JCM 21426 / NBRC 103028 / MMB-1) TaxID=717774 RepID=F2K369_MARM1|nr:Xaa-Pro dipeptidase [Marinomonas mediterranea]ADZ90122.1 Xaa-Pro dipeptidase [Marinomonas mediterranea MMB-1]WCN08186.1 Xaa-Pro dipeptidase [Marinomonas mediterranea]WCN12253.1 Xaa-Pro dipeptidase [Marinomonas mediterranea]WCN16326.1 Xaa-Pro dipeptidase [Marinomonas mediterranea MMB-1]